MAQYLVLIYEDETAWEKADAETARRIMGDHRGFTEDHRAELRGGNALEPTGMATSVRRDQAFVETKEALGGYYVIEAADLDQALAVAKEVPAPFGGVEVRPVRTIG